jgi:hypothetical protein
MHWFGGRRDEDALMLHPSEVRDAGETGQVAIKVIDES